MRSLEAMTLVRGTSAEKAGFVPGDERLGRCVCTEVLKFIEQEGKTWQMRN